MTAGLRAAARRARSSARVANRNRSVIDHRLSRQNVKFFLREPLERKPTEFVYAGSLPRLDLKSFTVHGAAQGSLPSRTWRYSHPVYVGQSTVRQIFANAERNPMPVCAIRAGDHSPKGVKVPSIAGTLLLTQCLQFETTKEMGFEVAPPISTFRV